MESQDKWTKIMEPYYKTDVDGILIDSVSPYHISLISQLTKW